MPKAALGTVFWEAAGKAPAPPARPGSRESAGEGHQRSVTVEARGHPRGAEAEARADSRGLQHSGGAAFTTQVGFCYSLALLEGPSVSGPLLDWASGYDRSHQR